MSQNKADILSLLLFSVFLLGTTALLSAFSKPLLGDMLRTDWTNSYKLYKQPHAIWLDNGKEVGGNLGTLQQALIYAERNRQRPEIVIYTIPLRDIEQASKGGFDTYDNYYADNALNVNTIARFHQKTGISPRIYLEPDALAHAIQYLREHPGSPKAQQIYVDRTMAMRKLIPFYQKAGAIVYLDAAHSGWFDYKDTDIDEMAKILEHAGIELADGLVLNVSNRQPVTAPDGVRSEDHYLSRLLPKLKKSTLDIIVDTGRNGGPTTPRKYYLGDDRQLFDNQASSTQAKGGRLIGSWQKVDNGDILFAPFFGKPILLSTLLGKEHYKYNELTRILEAPPWLDPIGDVQPGPPPTDQTRVDRVTRFRYIKPPDDCDGSLNCPAGASKSDIIAATEKLQPPPASATPTEPIRW